MLLYNGHIHIHTSGNILIAYLQIIDLRELLLRYLCKTDTIHILITLDTDILQGLSLLQKNEGRERKKK